MLKCKCMDCEKEWIVKDYDFNKSDIDMSTFEFCGFDYMKSYDKILEYVTSKEYRNLLKKYLDDLNEFQRRKVINYLLEGIKKGWSIKDIAKKIDMIIKDPTRSEIIARTETIRTINEGNRKALEDKDVKKVIWLSAPEDGRLCKQCKKMNNKIMTTKEIKGKIPLHPNCRCTFSEYVKI